VIRSAAFPAWYRLLTAQIYGQTVPGILANLVAAWPGRQAARTPAAMLLRVE